MDIKNQLKKVEKRTQQKFFHGNVRAQMGLFVTQEEVDELRKTNEQRADKIIAKIKKKLKISLIQ